MPTGYTQKLVKDGQTFNEFVLTCARAMGACVTMREDSMETPIPDEFKPDLYHAGALKEAQKKLEELQKMTPEQRLKFGDDKKYKEMELYKALEVQEEVNVRIAVMEEHVKKWTPPTEEHTHFKDFMLKQLDISKEDTQYYHEALAIALNKDPMEYYKYSVKDAQFSIDYHKKEYTEEVKRTNSRNSWIKALRESLK